MSTTALSDTDIDAIKTMMSDWTTALVNQDWSQWRSYWDEDAVLMPPDHKRIVGRAELVSFASASLGKINSFAFSDWTFDGFGDLAVVTNTIRIEVDGAAPEQPQAANDQMILVRKHADGNWLIHKVIFNGSAAA
ncbi:DUF4440 domain-containing protein [Nitratireductor sp. XY-223]|uniref:YybH family protein n=1 Tax=Nitratireductor sp. XY-223 TaxID=2561926 RepID=UPI00145A517C|nr:DUF4440 domain-containing protein [Nitratireductor sp. XY-223]